jgi:hypothetical protein
MYKINEERILDVVSRALDYQFEIYRWEQMIDDVMDGDFTGEEIQWAKEHIIYKVEVV